MKSEPKTKESFTKELAGHLSKSLGISEKAAELRLVALTQSGVLDGFNPEKPDKIFEFITDIAMQIPQIGNENE